MSERFTYSGPATIDGMQLPYVRLRENPSGSGRTSWEGTARFHATETPEGFPEALEGPSSKTLELPDGRTGQVFEMNKEFTGSYWIISLVGTGPAPC